MSSAGETKATPESAPESLESETAALGARIRRLRTGRGLSLKELSVKAGLSLGLLSQIERGTSSPSLRTLTKLRLALEVPLSALFPAVEGQVADSRWIRRQEDRARIDLGPSRFVKELLSPDGSRPLQLLLLTLPPGGGSGAEPYSYEGEKAGLVLNGGCRLRVGDEAIDLRKGDSFQFDSSIPHSFENPHRTEAKLLWIISKPPSPAEI